MCGMDATANGIGDAGAVALGTALESGQCQLEKLVLNGESVCLAACGAGLCAFRSGWHASFGRWRVCVRSGGRVWRCWMLSDCGCGAAVFWMCGMDATGNGIGEAGAVALAKALESGCKLASLDLRGESA